MVKVTHDSEASLKTIDILQSMIARMSGASAACKNWCITIVTAAAVFAADKAQPKFAEIAFFPILMLCALDIYYLTIERMCRSKYELFVIKLRNETADVNDLFDVKIGKISLSATAVALASPSIWPFYLLSAVVTYTVATILRS